MRRTVRRAARIALTSLATLALAACSGQEPERLEPEVLRRLPHDPAAFTQGLLLHDGLLYESTGLYGRSELREVDPESGEPRRVRPLPADVFAEGLALVGERLVQLTWREGTAFVWDRETFEPRGELRYEGEGWGLCWDGESLVMSDGSSRLAFRDPDTFEVRRTVEVRLRGEDGARPVERLNELACVEGRIWANVWLTDEIVRIDPEDGRVEAVVDASSLLPADERARLPDDAVLNGIAWDAERERFILGGKLWPALFEVRFRPAP